jgi:hypothetical protein
MEKYTTPEERSVLESIATKNEFWNGGTSKAKGKNAGGSKEFLTEKRIQRNLDMSKENVNCAILECLPVGKCSELTRLLNRTKLNKSDFPVGYISNLSKLANAINTRISDYKILP